MHAINEQDSSLHGSRLAIKTLSSYLKDELDLLKAGPHEIAASKKVLKETLLQEGGENYKKRKLRAINRRPIKNWELKDAYWRFSNRILKAKQMVHTRTWGELAVERVIKKYSKASVYHSFWIGPHCVDLFIPRYKLAIEINGNIHFNELKMRKDSLRDSRVMSSMGITVWEIRNEDVGSIKYRVIELMEKESPRASRVVKKMWRDIYIETLARVFPMEELSRMFNRNIKYLAIEMGWYAKEIKELNN